MSNTYLHITQHHQALSNYLCAMPTYKLYVGYVCALHGRASIPVGSGSLPHGVYALTTWGIITYCVGYSNLLVGRYYTLVGSSSLPRGVYALTMWGNITYPAGYSNLPHGRGYTPVGSSNLPRGVYTLTTWGVFEYWILGFLRQNSS